MRFHMRVFGKIGMIAVGALVMSILIAELPVQAQTGKASITGSVEDQTGAVVPDATITVVNTLTGQKAEAKTASNGTYVVPLLAVGTYSVTVEHTGFKSQTQSGIILTPDQVATVNITLTLGSTTQSVSVVANAGMVETGTAALGEAVSERAIVELPLNGRNPAGLVFLSAGMVNGANVVTGAFTNQTDCSDPNDTAASVNGGRVGSVFYMLDGATHMDVENLLGSPFPNPDATQEFRVIGNNFEAQYGFAPGAVVSIVTRSGTNQWHGDAFEFLRNYDLDAADFFSHKTDTLKRNQYGASMGGPIKKDKLFIFGNFQRTTESSSVSSSSTFVPNNTQLGGDWSDLLTGVTANLCGAGGPSDLNFDTGQIFQPSAGTPFVCPAGSALAGQTVKVKQPYANNYVNPATYNPVALKFEQSLPQSSAANGLAFLPAYPVTDTTNEFTIRSDYNINEHQRVSGHVFYQKYDKPTETGNGDLLASAASWIAPYTNYQGSWVWAISPTLVNNLVVSTEAVDESSVAAPIGKDGKPVSFSLYGSAVSDPISSQYPPSFEGLGVTGYFTAGDADWSLLMPRRATTISESLSWTKGKHLVIAGIDVLRFNWSEYCNWLELPLMSFDGETTGNAAADFLTGYVDSFEQGGGEYNQTRYTAYAPFIQDTIRLKPNLTVNAGIRWEPYFPPKFTDGRMVTFRPGEQSTRFPDAPLGAVYPGDAGISDSGGVPNSPGLFSPRIGIAWQPKFLRNTSIRGAFGLFVAPIENMYYHHMGDDAPFSPTYNLTYVSNGLINLSTPWASSAGTGFSNPFPPFSSLTYVPSANTQISLPMLIDESFGPNLTLGKDQTWNVSVEHQFTPNMMLTIAYVGSETYHLPILVEANPGIYAAGGARALHPQFTSVFQVNSWGTASYNGLQVSLEKRFSHGLQFRSNYTWSRTLDWQSTGNVFASEIGDPFDLRWNYGPADMNFPQVWVSNFNWLTPSLKNQNRLVQEVFGNWQPTGIITLESGPPFSIAGGCNGSNNSLAQIYGDLADRTGQARRIRQGSEASWVQQYFNPAAFQCNAPGTFGNSGRNSIQGPPLNNWDLGIDKEFPFKERYKVEFRWEMFDAFNTPHFSVPLSNPVAPGFGGIYSLATPPRIMQFALKFFW